MKSEGIRMKYEFHISKEDLLNAHKKDQEKFLQRGLMQRIRRSRKEVMSVADLSKIIVDRKAESIIVSGGKLEYLCRTLAKQYHVFTMRVNGISLKEYFFNNRFSMLCSYYEYYWDTIGAVINEDEERIEKIKKKVIWYLRRAKPKAIVTISFSRARPFDIILYDAAKKCNIPVILLEHGFLNNFTTTKEGMKKHPILGKYIDFYWCWNQKNRDIYIKNQLTSEEKSFVLGYPLQPKQRCVRVGEEVSVLFVGDWLEAGDAEANIRFYTVVNDVYKMCCKMGIPFKYKGHPSEQQIIKRKNVDKYLSADIICVDDLFEGFKQNSVVVGCRTSALIEAGYVGNYVIQIVYDYESQKDCIFEHCYVLEDYVHQFELLIKSIKEQEILPKELSVYEFYQPENLLPQFNKGLERVERYYIGNGEESIV